MSKIDKKPILEAFEEFQKPVNEKMVTELLIETHCKQIYLHIKKLQEDIFIEGLKRKGFSFDTKNELYEFIGKNCFRAIRPPSDDVEFYVNNEIFLKVKNFAPSFLKDNNLEYEYKLKIDYEYL